MELNVDGYNNVTWRQYREYTSLLQNMIPEEGSDLSLSEMTEIMFIAAVFSGWVIGMEKPETESPQEFLAEMQEVLSGEHPGNVIEMLDDFSEFYGKLRTPDPN